MAGIQSRTAFEWDGGDPTKIIESNVQVIVG